jgi:ADP-ribose pyrophosphatase YjhB (NUDIX family)
MMVNQDLVNNYHFCPRCTGRLEQKDNHLFCPKCELKIYYNPSLAVALIAFNEKGEVLLNRRKIPPNPGSWDTVGGFVNVGETVEQAIRREFKEETQAECEIVRYWGSYPDVYGTELSPTINLFFEVKILRGKLIASDDAAELRFFPLDQLPKKIAFANTQIFLNLLINQKKGQND